MLEKVLATAATLLVVGSYIPQVARAYRTKTLKDVSMWFLAIIFFGILTWIVYGIVMQDWIFVVANTTILCLSGTLIAMKLRYD